MEGVACERGYLDRVARPALIREYLLATSADPAAALAQFPAPDRPLPTASPDSLPPGSRGRRPAALKILAA